MTIDKQNLKLKVKEMLEKNNITSPKVDVFSIAKREGFDISYLNLDYEENLAGVFAPKAKNIFLNEKHVKEKQKFTISHMLGHCILKHDFIEEENLCYDHKIDCTHNPIKEQEANYFAVNLLVPDSILKIYLSPYDKYREKDVKFFASFFQVSPEVMRAQLKDFFALGLHRKC